MTYREPACGDCFCCDHAAEILRQDAALMEFYRKEGDFRRSELADTRAALRLAETELARLRSELARALAVLG